AIAEAARLLLPKGRAREHNQAMMELGALVCARRPDCPRCPLSPWCLARKRDTAAYRPVKKRGAAPVELIIASGVLLHEGRCFIQKREEDDVWGGLWEFPGGCAEKGEAPERAVVREYREETGFAVRVLGKYGVLKSTYTNHHITLHFYALAFAGKKPGPAPDAPALTAASECRWVPVAGLAGFAMPSLYRKAADALASGQWGMLGLLFPKD
ncbi:MAG: NUDIX domain-containing protein, partial [Desulfovibrio sp.]|nr:NUDIX domain-containing protein [Desulfovibrio sp.]